MSRTATLCGILCLGVPVALIALAFAAPSDDDGIWSRILLEVQSTQRSLHRELAATLEAVQEQGATAAAWLVGLSFVYGVLHAIGPGHGKVVITTYLITQRSRLGRGILLSVSTSLLQGLTALVAVAVGVAVLGQSLRHTQSTADDLELLSYALVAIAGLVVAIASARRLASWWSSRSRRVHPVTSQHSHTGSPVEQMRADAGGCCGHAHVPSPEQIDSPLSWRAIAGMSTAVGIRPCSGAIVVLLVAHSLGLHWAGVAAVLAMSIGTAIAVSVLAAIAVYARAFAVGVSARLPGSGGAAGVVLELVALSGGVAILVLGLLLFQAAWIMPVHPLR